MPDTLEYTQSQVAPEAAFSMRETSADQLAQRAEQESQDRLQGQAAEQPTVVQVQQEVHQALAQPEISVLNVRRVHALGYYITHHFRQNAIDLSEIRG